MPRTSLLALVCILFLFSISSLLALGTGCSSDADCPQAHKCALVKLQSGKSTRRCIDKDVDEHIINQHPYSAKRDESADSTFALSLDEGLVLESWTQDYEGILKQLEEESNSATAAADSNADNANTLGSTEETEKGAPLSDDDDEAFVFTYNEENLKFFNLN